MDWFRTLLNEKAHTFQVIVLTCRPSDYLPPAALVPDGSAVYADMDGEPIRAIDLERALRRR
jgi:ATP-dependent phosphoenolpyruvate carboxykinase